MNDFIEFHKDEQEVNLMPPLTWAYIGDCVYELYVRTKLVDETKLKIWGNNLWIQIFPVYLPEKIIKNMTKEISYIHFSDLHIGQKYANQYLSNAKDIVISDLNFICQELKALDIVFFTGDMVQSGAESEYESFFAWFEFLNQYATPQ